TGRRGEQEEGQERRCRQVLRGQRFVYQPESGRCVDPGSDVPASKRSSSARVLRIKRLGQTVGVGRKWPGSGLPPTRYDWLEELPVDRVLLDQPSEGASVFDGLSGGAGDVPVVFREELSDVSLFKLADDVRPRLAEAQGAGVARDRSRQLDVRRKNLRALGKCDGSLDDV